MITSSGKWNHSTMVHPSDVEVKCWISIYAIDATNPDDVLVERIGRLPLDASKQRELPIEMNMC